MLVQTYFPQRLAPARYDSFLASGWFRGSVMLYKMDLLCLEEDVYSVVNIRLNLPKFELRKGQRKVVRKVEREFIVTYGKAQTNANKEALYQQQKKKFKGFIHPTLNDYLNSGFHQTVFDTREICVYDGDKLIAVSFFDFGKNSMASLLGLYDEDYNSFSLGYYTMLKEIEIASKLGFKWYYPGYVLDQPSQFNYKLRLGEFEYYNDNQRWSKYEKFDADLTKASHFRRKLQEAKALLDEARIEYKEVLYPLFSMGYVGYLNAEFLKYPAYLEIVNQKQFKTIISFDLDQEAFIAATVVKAPNYEHLINMEASQEFNSNDSYRMQLLMVTEFLCVTPELKGLLIYFQS
ncbi:GNAT family N-acetyltransferase [Sanyastnella coralliicola]|uniref:GNAT family N-acetyltransferase n=1 Tax=Sanyastnella coralliicola TaxID=3069118 RepID=UPI0027BAAFE9|nr:GNAT family N-acetyltransferase [Longitalea sp. SCSIO 12813]